MAWGCRWERFSRHCNWRSSVELNKRAMVMPGLQRRRLRMYFTGLHWIALDCCTLHGGSMFDEDQQRKRPDER
ncbi:unnamed protein product [Chondrus crispus]|uniref:Uncharacterized protein n=1 Tax=Chondrus crispus TaxID=2769 RepID=R7QAN6_CHOCR|nr:unnamed protein product [Chondrus crispus]CDF35567.1 unnamed protein product [Chondrus crispus]|eukprot:XP_005715386.1 unnamed protein product [Chondrus crispus]